MGKTLTVTEAARNFSEVINRVFYRGESMELTRSGQVVARLVPAREFEPATAQSLLEAWRTLPHLTREEAEAFGEDVDRARAILNQAPASKWD